MDSPISFGAVKNIMFSHYESSWKENRNMILKNISVHKTNQMRPDEKKEFYKELLALAIPIGLQNLLVALIGATDALMLGRLTQESVAAVSLANQIGFIMNLFIGAAVGGGGTLIAQYWGNGDRIMVKNLFCMMIKWVAGISLIFFCNVLSSHADADLYTRAGTHKNRCILLACS